MSNAPPELEFQPADLYLNRELSLLEFNRRVLAQALDEAVPLLERLKFLCISSANLDEFFEIRVAGLQQMAELNPGNRGADGLSPAETLVAIASRAHALVAEQYRVFNEVLIPALEKEKIRFVRRSEWTAEQDGWLRQYFQNELLPVLSPIGLDPAHPFPRILNKSLNFIVQLSGKDAFGRNTGYAIVQAPRALPRLIQIPREVAGSGPYDFVFLSSVIHAYVDELFPGMEASGCYQFRLTRNSDLLVDEEEAKDLMEALEGELSQRQWGDIVRLEVAHNCPEQLWRYLMEVAQLNVEDVYQVNGPVNLHRLMAIPDLIDRNDLKYAPFNPRVPKALAGDLFAAMRERDQLLHHPYDAFAPVVEFLRQAARDPKVLAIKQTLYRTGDRSAIVDALVEAASAGKEVTVVVELRARFDEANNIDLAEKLQDVGAHVVYGVVGYKTHAKMCLVVRREDTGALRNYVHLGTGNYHPRTARQYTDYGLFTADAAIGKDVHAVFLQLTSLGKVTKLNRLLQSPFTLAKQLHAKIEREIENAKKHKPAQIIAKMNSLVEAEMIQALYRASQAGVQIELIVRGMCSLRPGVKGLSENIRVRSVVGRFLEHHRVYYFANGGEAEMYLSSADWMERNLFKRVEVAFPVLDKKLRERILIDLQAYLADSAQSWLLQADGSYQRPEKIEGKPVQQRLMEEG
ncbi:polyphosphate kinase [Solimonas aquatica]|uniref:Polyphosphate kinase n=1 Tax=Solimonas aquatica TaxID=489703 RepID=A0A1H9EV00_9GAMM|nr:polyphosphate kinase 1 [Solimonas aquatica]SEQ29475.1 polyphosphate kinase [Solimonas aquatica]